MGLSTEWLRMCTLVDKRNGSRITLYGRARVRAPIFDRRHTGWNHISSDTNITMFGEALLCDNRTANDPRAVGITVMENTC